MRYRETGLSARTFWAALALLLLNDHVLKGAGVLPGWVTGKLSDFAGLVVAPVLAAAVTAALGRRARAVGFGAVVALFVGINTSPSCARGVEWLLQGLGRPSRLWVDPSDLVALVVVPWAARLCFGPPRKVRERRHRPRRVDAVAVALAGFACLATSDDLGNGVHAYVVNATRFKLDVRVHRAVDVDCSALAGRERVLLRRSAFTFEAEHQVLPLETQSLDPEGSVGGFDDTGRCGAVLLEVEGLDDTIVTWSDLDAVGLSDEWDYGDDIERAVVLWRAGDQLVPEVGDDLTVLGLAELDLTPSCSEPGGSPLEWSGFTDGTFAIASVQADVGCMDVHLSEPSGDGGAPPAIARLCTPTETFPFAAGDRVSVRVTENILTLLDADRTGTHVSYRRSVVPSDFSPSTCDGVEVECGAVVLPVTVAADPDGFDADLGAGELATVDDNGVVRTLYVVRAEQVLRLGDACGGARDAFGATYDSALMQGFPAP